MNRIAAVREGWQPKTRQECESVLEELHAILASPHFCNSKRYPALLRYIVEKTLAGEAGTLKERTLGVEVFDRPPSYDTNADTVVRYTAGEVRKRLSLYYHELGQHSAIQIQLPVGSYVPEFSRLGDENQGLLPSEAALLPGTEDGIEADVAAASAADPVADHAVQADSFPGRASVRTWVVLGLLLVALSIAVGMAWKSRADPDEAALNEFWNPVLRDQRSVLICTGGTTFLPNDGAGFTTADKNTDYPYVSLQIASSIARLSSLFEAKGKPVQLEESASTPLTDLRERSVILLGGYNNQWTLRLLQSARFNFRPAATPGIVDAYQAGSVWQRDYSVPYSSADDYAVVARFRDQTTDSWVVALAGVGRNGTEAATQFATNPHYLQMLRSKAGNGYATRNLEVVLKVNVIEGKTGAPSIVAMHFW